MSAAAGDEPALETIPGRPPVVDAAAWQAARARLLEREKAHTREGDAIAAQRRRLPMLEVDAATEVVGPDGAVPFLDLFAGREELLVYKHMWHDGAPHQGQCEGCTITAWNTRQTVYLAARGISFAILSTGIWEEVERFVHFMGYPQPWYSVRGLPEPIGGDMGYLCSFLREGDRAFLTYSTTGRGTEFMAYELAMMDLTPYGRREGWQEVPDGWPGPIESGAPVGGHGAPISVFWRTDAEGTPTWGPTGRPVPQWTRPGATPVETMGRHDDCCGAADA